MEIIDLTSDNDLPASAIVDLTSVDDLRASSHVSRERQVKVEDESSTLAGSSTADSGGSSPSTQRDDDIAQTESNPTDVGDLSPRNPQDQGGSSADEGLTLSTILARGKKRKRDSGDAHTSESTSTDMSKPLTPKALDSLVGSQSLKLGLNNFFCVHKRVVNEPPSEKSKQDERPKTAADESARIQKGRPSAMNANPHILNIVREEVFGKEKKKKKKKKHHGDPSSQEEPAKQHIQVDGQSFSTPAPPRAASEAPETVRPKKIENYGSIRQPKAHEETEHQRPHKRRKHSSRGDSISGSVSHTVASNTRRSQVESVAKLQGHKSKTNGVERSRPAGKDKATDIPNGSTRYRPGGSHRVHLGKATHHESRQKKDPGQAGEKADKSKRADSGRQLGEKAYLVAALNERGAWAPNGVQRAGMTSQRPLESRSTQKATSGRNDGLEEARGGRRVLGSGATGTQFPLESNHDRDEGLYEPIEKSYGLEPGGKGSQVPLESKAGYKAHVRQNEDLRKDREMPDFDLQQPQQVHSSGGQQDSHSIQLKLNTAQAARRLDQHQQTMVLADKDLEDTRDFFRKHPSQLAHQHKTMFLESIPSDVGKPTYPDRHRVVKRITGERKDTHAIQIARKRDRDRKKQIKLRRERLETQVNEMFPHESEQFKQQRVEAGVAELLKIHARNDEKREAEKAQGLLTVKFIEGAEDDPIDGQPAAPPKGNSRGIPVAKALEPGATITLYVVYKSEPFEKGKKFGDYRLNRMEDQFFRKEDANKHAEAVLRNDRYDDSHLVSIQFRVGPEDGLFFGTKELANEKLVMCMVQKERQMSSDLDLRDVFVRKELKQIYCPRYDVFHTHVIPKVFLESEEGGIDGDKEKKSKTKTPSPDMGEGGPESGENEQVDRDSDSLFSGPPTPEPGSGDESNTDSIATSATMEPLQPGGNMGSLSWNDVDYVHEHVGSFTTLELANKEALKVALERWRPKDARLDSWLYYRDAIKPSLKEIWAQDLDVDKAKLEFEVPEFEGHVNDRPWRFIYSTVYVRETKLEGPRDIGNHILSGNCDNDGEQSGGEDGGDGEDGEDD
ncbi:hypothetical protein LA080_003302 [Diaporthe eres]|nr:hypothetical protein LA080_003302 [Diaporthe eres]